MRASIIVSHSLKTKIMWNLLFVVFVNVLCALEARPSAGLIDKLRILTKDDIVFPDSVEAVERMITKPTCAEGSTFCESIANYPQQKVRVAIGTLTARQHGFFDASEDEEDGDDDSISQRIGDDEEVNMCTSHRRTIYPKVAKTRKNEWKFIVNQRGKDGYVQGVRVEMCHRPNQPCELSEHLPKAYTSICKQKYFHHRMLALNDAGVPMVDTFVMPSACCCTYKLDTGFLARFGRLPITPIK